MYAAEYYNDLIAEETGFKKWEREMKKRILTMTNPQKKQELWKQLFPIMSLDDSYLNNTDNIF